MTPGLVGAQGGGMPMLYDKKVQAAIAILQRLERRELNVPVGWSPNQHAARLIVKMVDDFLVASIAEQLTAVIVARANEELKLLGEPGITP